VAVRRTEGGAVTQSFRGERRIVVAHRDALFDEGSDGWPRHPVIEKEALHRGAAGRDEARTSGRCHVHDAATRRVQEA
jgi:hypothetical protein